MPKSESWPCACGLNVRMYRHWRQDPKSVHVSWATYFSGLDKGLPSSTAYTPPPGFGGVAVPQPAGGSPHMNLQGSDEVTDYLKVGLLFQYWTS